MTDDEILSALHRRLDGIEAHVKDPTPRPLRSRVAMAPIRPARSGRVAPALVAVVLLAIAGFAVVPRLGGAGPDGASVQGTSSPGAASVEPDRSDTPSVAGDLVIDGIAVRCVAVERTACEGIATRGILQFGRGGPGPDVIVRSRADCPPVGSIMDPTACWDVEAPRDAGTHAPCIVIGRSRGGTYAQVAGDSVSGLMSPQGSTPSGCPAAAPEILLDPPTTPEEPAGRCMNHHGIYERFLLDLHQRVRGADTVVVGTVTGVGSGRWESADGRPVTRPTFVRSPVVTMFRLDVERIVKGAAPSTITGATAGGSIGCHSWSETGLPRSVPVVGDRYVFLFGPPTTVAGEIGVRDLQELGRIEGEFVRLMDEGEMTLEAFLERVRGGP